MSRKGVLIYSSRVVAQHFAPYFATNKACAELQTCQNEANSSHCFAFLLCHFNAESSEWLQHLENKTINCSSHFSWVFAMTLHSLFLHFLSPALTRMSSGCHEAALFLPCYNHIYLSNPARRSGDGATMKLPSTTTSIFYDCTITWNQILVKLSIYTSWRKKKESRGEKREWWVGLGGVTERIQKN